MSCAMRRILGIPELTAGFVSYLDPANNPDLDGDARSWAAVRALATASRLLSASALDVLWRSCAS
jgi:hypothetical protein